MKNYKELTERIKGPVYPVLPAFKEDFSLDLDKTADYVEFLNSRHVGAILLTAGTSRYNLMTRDEIIRLNKRVMEANNRRAVAIAANPMVGGTGDTIAFAVELEKSGADAVLLYYPERYYGDDAVFDYFKMISQSVGLGIMAHTLPIKNGVSGPPQIPYSLDLCSRLTEIESFIGLKEESNDRNLIYKLGVHLGERLALVVAGGGMRTFMGCMDFGISAYLTGLGNLKPELEESFYKAMKERDRETALGIVSGREEPFFNAAIPMGWHIALKGAMDLMSLMPAFERPPLKPVSSEDREVLRGILTGFGWI